MMPKISYIVCASPRSGSNLLCEALRFSGMGGFPEEYFLAWYAASREPERLEREPWLIASADFLHTMFEKGTTPNGVFGVKVMWSYFDVVMDNLRRVSSPDLSPPAILARTFPNLHYIHMSRRDKARQAVSMAKAIQSGKWIDLEPWVEEAAAGPRPPGRSRHVNQLKTHLQKTFDANLVYDFDQIARLEQEIQAHEEAWQAWFEKWGIRPYRVVYEDFVDSYERAAREVLAFLGVPDTDNAAFTRRALRRQSDAVNDEWSLRYREECARQR